MITEEEVNKERIKEVKRVEELCSLDDPDKSPNLRNPLSIETETVKKILLSWGGGEDGFKLYFDGEKELLRGVYFMADWGVYKESALTIEEAELIYDFYMGGYFE